jgi:hypothetical protein
VGSPVRLLPGSPGLQPVLEALYGLRPRDGALLARDAISDKELDELRF